ncbi:MAG: hypothetical protein QOJ99_4185 [Bryobacterales bacterium]|jgi:hypothetical protein|nr:hypothetical protein [Bryobacterales bacterium]
MRPLTVCLVAVTLIATLHASIIPTVHLDQVTLAAYQEYVTSFEKTVLEQFNNSGRMWIDSDSKKGNFDAGKPVVEPRRNEDLANGSVHHFSGSIHVNGANIDSVRKVMQDYSHYVEIFKPDLGSASGTREADSTPEDEHFKAKLMLVQTTLWMSVTYDTLYDTHYRRTGKDRWTSRSVALNIKEARDPKNPAAGYLPEGDDHGFLWKTNTYWLARERNGGLDLQADSIALSRPNPTGFAWWGTRRSREAVDKMLKDVKAGIENHNDSHNDSRK